MVEEINFVDSQIPWLGNIPSHWSTVRGRYLFKYKKELNKDMQCENLLSLTLLGVLRKDLKSNQGLRPTDYRTYQIFESNDLVFKMIDLANTKTSRVGIVNEKGIMSPVYLRHEPKCDKIFPRFAYWYYVDLYNKKIFNSIGTGVRASLSSNELLELVLPVPPLKEQELIASYLDSNIEKVNSIIESLKQKKILLKEAIATNFFEINIKNTKKINHHDSWFQSIPEDWIVIKFKQLFEPVKITNNSENERLLSVTQDKGVVYRDEQDKDVVNPAGDISSYKLVNPGNFVISLRSADGGIEVSNIRGLVSPAYTVLRTKLDIDVNYYKFLLTSKNFITEINRYIKGVRDGKNINFEDIKDISIPILPLDSWNEDYKKLIIKHQNVVDSFDVIDKKIELLKDYKQSLIASCVSGQKFIG